MPLKKLLTAFSFFLSVSVFGQTHNLCGIWMGYGYTQYCEISGGFYTVCPVPIEIISIQQIDSLAIATKIVGDNCVTSGQITWQGYNTSDTFNVTATVGSIFTPNAATVPAQVTYLDSNHLTMGFGAVNYVRATCKQIDSMSNLFTNANIPCTNCGILSMPNTFTPNGDGINDMFMPVIGKNLQDYSMKIYSRWGTLLFSNTDYSWGWDGRTNNQNCPTGTYYYECTYKTPTGEELSKNGFLELIR